MPDPQTGVPLAPLTTLRLGGPAQTLVTASTPDELTDIVRDADRRREPLLLLAGGSNVVIADDGFAGTVVLIRTRGLRRRRVGERALVTAQAGEDWDAFVAATVDDGLAGLECLAGIPGSVGGTPIQNVGAYGQEVASTIVSVRVLDRKTHTVADLSPEQCGFGYRTSVFKHASRYVVLAVTFVLADSAAGGPVRYPELARALDAEVGENAPAAAIREAVLGLRRAKGMVLDAGDHDTWSAGSFFTNPVLDASAFEQLLRRAAAVLEPGCVPPAFTEGDGRTKTSAAWLIEQAGFEKGHGRGAARLSTKHVLAITNRGTATAREVLALADELTTGVRDRFGIELTPEPVFVGIGC